MSSVENCSLEPPTRLDFRNFFSASNRPFAMIASLSGDAW
jgi:hypothetical protein